MNIFPPESNQKSDMLKVTQLMAKAKWWNKTVFLLTSSKCRLKKYRSADFLLFKNAIINTRTRVKMTSEHGCRVGINSQAFTIKSSQDRHLLQLVNVLSWESWCLKSLFSFLKAPKEALETNILRHFRQHKCPIGEVKTTGR